LRDTNSKFGGFAPVVELLEAVKMANIQIPVEIPKDAKAFPCACGDAFDTAEEFSDHVHTKHAELFG
jgi:hypothetical protein